MKEAQNDRAWFRRQSPEVIEAIDAMLDTGMAALAISKILKKNGISATRANIESYISNKKKG